MRPSYLLFLIAAAVSVQACADKRPEIERQLYPDGTPPNVEFVEVDENWEPPDNPPNSWGKSFLDEVSAAGSSADQIVVVEHSHQYDLPPSENSPKVLVEKEYGRIELSSTQR